MNAPDKIWAKAQEWPKGSGRTVVYATATQDPDEPNIPQYTRTDLTPPAADYVAGLEAAMIVYRDNLWREIMGGEGCRGHPCCVSPKGEGCDCHDKFERIEKYAGDQALAARPAAPDTRVTLSQIADWFDAVANPARAQSPQHMAANYRDRLHAIINGGQDRG